MTKEVRDALSAMLGRLKQVNSLWHQALDAYFVPNRFRIAAQGFITTSRTVTFIVQSHKNVISGFDVWYESHRERFASDPVMVWAKGARNKIEKQGDLETLSQIRVELIAAYAWNPITDWAPASVFASLDDIRRAIPTKYLYRHVIENGILSIERRWVDIELPDHEILDAMAHVYGQLAKMLISLHEHLSVAIPAPNSSLGEPLSMTLLPDGRTPSMERPLEDRAVYISVKSGSVRGYRNVHCPMPLKNADKLFRKYRKVKPLEGLAEAKNATEVAHIIFKTARALMLNDHHHISILFLFKELVPVHMIEISAKDRADKYLLMRETARTARQIGADAVFFVSEAWPRNPKTCRREGLPSTLKTGGNQLSCMEQTLAANRSLSPRTLCGRRSKSTRSKACHQLMLTLKVKIWRLRPSLGFGKGLMF